MPIRKSKLVSNIIQLIVFDCDGVLTDGSIIIDDEGRESKNFYVRDGFGIKAAMTLGLKVGVITGRNSPSVGARMKELGIELYQKGVSDKGQGLQDMCRTAGVPLLNTAYVGDDLIDLPAMKICGLPMAVKDACPEARAIAKYITTSKGGRGGAREAIEYILKEQGLWQKLVHKYAK